MPGVRGVGGIGVTQLGARVPGNGPRDLVDVALFGYQVAPEGVPAPPPEGAAYADRLLADEGVSTGRHVAARPGTDTDTVLGFVDDVSYSGAGTLWASPATWRTVQNANRPGSSVTPGVFQALVVTTDGDSGAVARSHRPRHRWCHRDGVERDASDAIGGVREQRSVFNQIIGVTLVIAAVVVGLFFALLTVERVGLYGMLKAIGARSRTLFGGVIAQAIVVALFAAVVALRASRSSSTRRCHRARSRTSCCPAG